MSITNRKYLGLKNECLILVDDNEKIVDMDFVPTTTIEGDTWTAADLSFDKIRYSRKLEQVRKSTVGVMYYDFATAVYTAEHIKGWHLPTHDEAIRLAKALNKNSCRYSAVGGEDYQTIYPKCNFHYKRSAIRVDGCDLNFNAEFNGYYFEHIFEVDAHIDKHWLNQPVDDFRNRGRAEALWLINRRIPNDTEKTIRKCLVDAQYPLRLVKDK